MVTGAGPGLRIAFFGTPEFAVPSFEALLQSLHHVVGVVTQPDQPGGRGQRLHPSAVKRVAVSRQIPLLQPERLTDAAFLEAFGKWRADLAVVAAYGKIFREALLRQPRLGFINVHASLLPRFRGAAPVHRAVMAGDTMTGVTIMRIVRALDAGPMLAAAARPIEPDETSEQVDRGLSAIGATLLLHAVDDLAHGRAVEVPQDDTQASFAPRIEKTEGLIDWSRPAAAIHNQVRGLHPWPHAYTYLGETRYIVHRTRAESPGTQPGAEHTPRPGETLRASGDVLSVATGDGSLNILEIQPEGRRVLTAREFLAGRRIEAGAVFGRPASR